MTERCQKQVFVDEGFPYGCCARVSGHAPPCILLTDERAAAEATLDGRTIDITVGPGAMLAQIGNAAFLSGFYPQPTALHGRWWPSVLTWNLSLALLIAHGGDVVVADPCEMVNPHHPDCTCRMCLDSVDDRCAWPAVATHEGSVRVCGIHGLKLEEEGFTIAWDEPKKLSRDNLTAFDPGEAHYADARFRCKRCGSCDLEPFPGPPHDEAWKHKCRTCGADPA